MLPSSSSELLSHIGRVAQAIKHRLPTIDYRNHGVALSPSWPSIDLRRPTAEDIRPYLQSLGIPSNASSQLSEAYVERATLLRDYFLTQNEKTCKDLQMLPSSSTSLLQPTSFHRLQSVQKSLYEKQINSWRDHIISEAQSRMKSRVKVSAPAEAGVHKAQKTFNHGYVPLLEHYFDENQFPSRADKVFLAKKTNMTFRQIHVWFQNRRNRIRKDGKALRRSTICSGPKLPLDTLINRMGDRIVPEDQRLQSTSSEDSGDESNEDDVNKQRRLGQGITTDLVTISPPHAFPSTYPPSCGYNPFPCKEGLYRFDIPPWARRPAPALMSPSHPPDFSQLVDRFAHLSIQDNFVPRSGRKRTSAPACGRTTRQSEQSATIPFRTCPYPAPLPALIKTTPVSSVPKFAPLQAVAATAARLHVFNTPSPQSKLTTLVPNAGTETPTGKVTSARKIAPLPKRIPKGTSIAHRNITPAMSEASVIPSLSLTSPSRTSSYGSSEIQLFSGTSSSSSSSPRVRTPATSYNSLPRIVTPTLSMPGFSPYQQPSSMSDLFADSPVGTPLQAEGLQLDMNFFGDPHIAKASDFDFFGIPPSTNLVHAQS